jgi:UDP-N-acetylglucosamine acyltransferase
VSIHQTAAIDRQADVHPSTLVGPHAFIDDRVRIGPDCQIGPFAVILRGTEIGSGCRIHAHAVIGDLPQDQSFDGSETFCRVGNECTVREGATIHRASVAGATTVVGDRCLLMTNSHVGHDCVVGDDVVLVSGSLLGGHVEVGDRAVISGNAAVHQFVRVGQLAIVGGLGKVVQDVPPFFMTDRDGAVVGLNVVGLRRAGISPDERREIKEAYRLIYRSGLCHADIIRSLSELASTPSGQALLQFLSAESRRGLTRETRRHSKEQE